jgi:hypothetical protein
MRAALRRLKADGVDLEDITEEAGLPTADVRELVATSAGTRHRIDP